MKGSFVRFGALAAALAFSTAANAATCTDAEITRAAEQAAGAVPPAYLRPQMMAVGDSMYNGVTSLVIDARRADLSTPSLVARVFGLASFRVPTYPRPLVHNLEEELSHSPYTLFETIRPKLVANIKEWQRDYPKGGHGPATTSTHALMFDNVAVAQATSNDMLCGTAGVSDLWWRGNEVSEKNVLKGILFWYQSINTSFLLNPRDVPALAGLSQIAQVRLRKPQRLLVNIGSNDGVWKAAFEGAAPPEPELKGLVENMRMLVRLIPAETKFAYINNLVSPSRVPNLKPHGDLLKEKCDGRLYYERYETYLTYRTDGAGKALGLNEISGQTACQFDRRIDEVNAEIKKEMLAELAARKLREPAAGGINLVFVDFNRLLNSYDRKHDPKSNALVVKWGTSKHELDNLVIRRGLIHREGGITGYDNMHPTMVMYARGAQEVANEILSAEANSPSKPTKAFEPELLPQCVADELRLGYPLPPCPPRPKLAPLVTSIDLGKTETYNLKLVHTILDSMRSNADPRSLVDAIEPEPSAPTAPTPDASTAEKVGTGCIIAETLNIMRPVQPGVKPPGEPPPTDRKCEDP